jgi:pimeloyl-ACP methyl ester carboxylesterase
MLLRVGFAARLVLPALLSWFVLGNASAAEVEFRRQFVDGSHGQVHVLTSRPASEVGLQTPYVCFAPNPMAGRYFREFMKVLGTDRVMIAPDYPGLGESDPSAAPMDMAGYVASMAETLEALGYGLAGNGRVDVSGYHTGAFVAVELAISRPDLVRKVVLMGVPFYTGAARQAQYEETVVPEPLEEDFDSVRKWWEFTVTNREKGVTLERAYDNFVDVLKPKFRHSWPYQAVFTYPAEERAPLVRQPVLILNTHGGLVEQTRAIAPYFPDARLVEIPELHHGIFDVGPEILAGHARPFLNDPD